MSEMNCCTQRAWFFTEGQKEHKGWTAIKTDHREMIISPSFIFCFILIVVISKVSKVNKSGLTGHHKVHHDIFPPLQHDRLAEERLGIGGAPGGRRGPYQRPGGGRGRRRVEAGRGGRRGRSRRRGRSKVGVLETLLALPAAMQQQVNVLRQTHHAAASLHQLQLHEVAVPSRRVAPLLNVDYSQQGVDSAAKTEG